MIDYRNQSVTLFSSLTTTDNPQYITIKVALDRIKNGNSKEIVTKVYKGDKEAKKQLPCIIFAGEFSKRNSKSLLTASNFAVLDFDNTKDSNTPFEDATALRNDLKEDAYIYSAWLSPSLKGVKALVKIPTVENDEEYKKYYLALLVAYPELDHVTKDISRISFESYDPNVWINEESEVWSTEYVEPTEKSPHTVEVGLHPNYVKKANESILQLATNIITGAIDGGKHEALLKASTLLGGYVGGGIIDEMDAREQLKYAVGLSNYDKSYPSDKTIKDGLSNGIARPLQLNPLIKKTTVSTHNTIQEIPSIAIDYQKYIVPKYKGWGFIDDFYDGKVELGIKTGVSFFDRHFAWKKNEFYTITGSKGRGKTTIIQALSLIATVGAGWKWIYVLKENNTEDAKENLFQYLTHQLYKTVRDTKNEETKKVIEYIENNFIFLEDITTMEQVLETAKHVVNSDKNSTYGLFIDPENSFLAGYEHGETQVEYSNGAKIAVKVLEFSQKVCTVVLSQHTIMSAQRNKIASSAHAEGGWYTSKASFTIAISREQGSSDNFISIDNVRRQRTGGRETDSNNAIILEWNPLDFHIRMESSLERQPYFLSNLQDKKDWKVFNIELPKEEPLPTISPADAFSDVDLFEEKVIRKVAEVNKVLTDKDCPF